MPDQLRDRLQSSLGAAYTLERELGGGGMARVFVATDTTLGRQVVVKVLSPEMAEGLSAERFTREIRLAAALVVGDGGLVSHFTGPEDLNGVQADLSCATRVDWLQAMTPIEPIRFIAHASPIALLLQSGRLDNLVPATDAGALHAAAPQPKTIRWYDAGHGLNQQAVFDRLGWLHEEIGLDARQ